MTVVLNRRTIAQSIKVGDRFGRWTVVEIPYLTPRGTQSISVAKVRCDCGSIRIRSCREMRVGNTKSCGCFNRDQKTVHGLSEHPLYGLWRKMLHRCTNPGDKKFRYYGGRGITVYEPWKTDLLAFAAHMGERPSRSHSIDRIDNALGYCPGNVKWSTQKQQTANTRRNVWVDTPKGRMIVADAADAFGIPRPTLYTRIESGWPAEHLLDPPGSSGNRPPRHTA